MKLILNLLFFQILWHACIGGGGKGWWWLGLPLLIAYGAYHFSVTPWKKADAQIVLIAVLIGSLSDTVLVQSNILRYQTALPWPEIAPVWIWVLWAGFALTLNHSMAFFKNKFWLALLFGLLGGPLAYYGAAKVYQAVVFTSTPWVAYVTLGILWAILTPLLLQIADRLVNKETAEINHRLKEKTAT